MFVLWEQNNEVLYKLDIKIDLLRIHEGFIIKDSKEFVIYLFYFKIDSFITQKIYSQMSKYLSITLNLEPKIKIWSSTYCKSNHFDFKKWGREGEQKN